MVLYEGADQWFTLRGVDDQDLIPPRQQLVGQRVTATARADDAMRAREPIGNIDRRRERRGLVAVGHGWSPAGGAGACETEGGTSAGVTLPPCPRNAGRSTGPTVTSLAVGAAGIGGVVPI